MKFSLLRQCVALSLSGLLASSSWPLQARASVPAVNLQAGAIPLAEAMTMPYLDLFDLARERQYTAAEIQSTRDVLKQAGDLCEKRFKDRSKQYGKDIEAAQKQLKDAGGQISESDRHELHCKIQNLRALQSQTEVLAKHAIPIAYENRKAKLDLIEQWPAEY